MSKINYGKTHNKYQGKTAMTFGNKKMSIPLFSLTPIKCCPGSTELCRRYCYAMKAQRLFEDTRNKRQRNYELTMADHFTAIIIEELKNNLIPYVRIHESGDFYCQSYLEKWYQICEALPEKKFMAFTKNFSLDFSQRPDNLVIYNSIWLDTTQEDLERCDSRLKKAYTVFTKDVHKKRHYGRLFTGSSKKCKGYCDTCLICFTNQYSVYFPMH